MVERFCKAIFKLTDDVLTNHFVCNVFSKKKRHPSEACEELKDQII